MKINKVLLIFLLLAISSITSQLGIIYNINILKYISSASFIFVLLLSLYQIIIHNKIIDWKYAIVLLTILYFYPLISISIDVFSNFSFKLFTDGFIIKGGYYHLIIISLALVTFSDRINFYEILRKYIFLTYPIAILLIFLTFKASIDSALSIGFLAFNNVLIPGSLLVFLSKDNKDFILGWLSILLILFVSSYLGSRSYTLISFYFILFAFIFLYKKNKKLILKISFIGALLYLIGGLSFFNKTSSLREENILDRFQFESLVSTFNKFLENFDFTILFMWEGNSRSGILIHAFKNFDFYDWLLGKGLFATYHSFIERSTIELHWAQETFRWGIIYTIFTIFIFLIAKKYLKNYSTNYNKEFIGVIGILVFIKLLDGFIYGMPSISLYNVLVFYGIMLLSIKNKKVMLND